MTNINYKERYERIFKEFEKLYNESAAIVWDKVDPDTMVFGSKEFHKGRCSMIHDLMRLVHMMDQEDDLKEHREELKKKFEEFEQKLEKIGES